MRPNFQGTVAPGCVTLTGELDCASANEAREVLDKALAEEPNELRVQLATVSFCDSSGLAILIHARNQAVAANIRLVLERPGPAMLRLLDITGLQDQFLIE